MNNLLKMLFEQYKYTWLYREISGYKGRVYFKFDYIDEYETEIVMVRYYPKTKKWETNNCSTMEYLAKLNVEEDEEIIRDLEAKHAVFLLTKER